MTTSLSEVVCRQLADLVAARGTRVVVLGSSRDVNAKVTLLLTPPGARRPRLAVKTATTDVAAQAVVAEAVLLEQLQRLPLEDLRWTVPTVVEVAESSGRPALVCEVLPGTPMSVGYHAWRHTARQSQVSRDLRTVSTWLARWQTVTAGPASLVSWPEEVRSQVASRHAGEPCLAQALQVLDTAAGLLSGVRTPRTAVHGDLWVGNVLCASGRVTGVVDWEAGSLAGEPLRDLARLVTSYALYLDRHTRPGRKVRGHRGLVADSWGAGVTYALTGTGWFPDLARSVLREGLGRLGVDPELWRAVAHTGLAEVAACADEPEFALNHLELLSRQSHGGRL